MRNSETICDKCGETITNSDDGYVVDELYLPEIAVPAAVLTCVLHLLICDLSWTISWGLLMAPYFVTAICKWRQVAIPLVLSIVFSLSCFGAGGYLLLL